MIDRKNLIDGLIKAVDKAASFAIKNGTPIPGNKNDVWVGNTVIRKNKNGSYDIFSLDKILLFSDISVFDVAIIIAQRHTSNQFNTVEKVLHLEKEYSKYRTNMMHYLHCIKGAKKRRDYEAMAILEDKFQVDELRAKKARNDITIFKRVK